ncbi:MAG: LNR domain-containing protein [Myxococcota bacterium]|nr:LNR domain-containing protein [Myxococcota bacterium]
MKRRRVSFSGLSALILTIVLLNGCGLHSPTKYPSREEFPEVPQGTLNPQAICGDGILTDNEVCDSTNLNGESCLTLGFDGGTLECSPDCLSFETRHCFHPIPGTGGGTGGGNGGGNGGEGGYCGDGVLQSDEQCDGYNVGSITCLDFGFSSGYVTCAPSCDAFDISQCTDTTTGPATCGNNATEGAEICDGEDLAGYTCDTFGFVGGTLLCTEDCTGFYTAHCNHPPQSICGNNTLEPGEVCDGPHTLHETCQSFGFDGGELRCNSTCTGFSTAQCLSAPVECAPGCSPLSVGDAICDPACYTAACSFDGGDCTPPEWTCDPATFTRGDGCHCGCGAMDLDCADPSINSCHFNGCPEGMLPSATNNAECVPPPGWACASQNYASNDGCDCGCGVADPDCNSPLLSACNYSWCPEGYLPDENDNRVCVGAAPAECAPGCAASWVGDNQCDAACNTEACQYDLGDCASQTITWVCSTCHYGTNDGCDCGCGAVDPDCLSTEVLSCDYSHCPEGYYPDSYDNAFCVPL